MITDWTFYLAAVPAVFLLGLAKGGFAGLGMVALPLMVLVVPPLQGAAIILPILMVQDVISVWAFRKTWDRRCLLLFMPGALAGLAVGALLAARVSNAAVELIVGFIAAGFVTLHWIRGKPADAPPRQPHMLSAIFWGTTSGFTSFIANTGGVPFQAYAVPMRLPPSIYAGTSTMLFFVLNWIKFIIFIALGQVSADNLSTSAVLLPLAVVATLTGVWLVRRVSARNFYAIITAATFVLGMKLIYDGAASLVVGWSGW